MGFNGKLTVLGNQAPIGSDPEFVGGSAENPHVVTTPDQLNFPNSQVWWPYRPDLGELETTPAPPAADPLRKSLTYYFYKSATNFYPGKLETIKTDSWGLIKSIEPAALTWNQTEYMLANPAEFSGIFKGYFDRLKITPAAGTLLNSTFGINIAGWPQSQDVEYSDFTFKIDKQFSESDQFQKIMGISVGSRQIRIKPVYNYFLTPYEQLTSKDLFVKWQGDNLNNLDYYGYILPNIYSFVSDMVNKSKEYFDNISFLDPGIPNCPTCNAIYNFGDPVSLGDTTNYLNRFAIEADRRPLISANLRNTKKYATVGISVNHLDYLKIADEQKNKFPMYVEVEIPTLNSGEIGELLRKNNYFDDLMQIVMAATYAKHMPAAEQQLMLLGESDESEDGVVELEPVPIAKVPTRNYTIFKEDTRINGNAGSYFEFENLEDSIRKEDLVTFDLTNFFNNPLNSGAIKKNVIQRTLLTPLNTKVGEIFSQWYLAPVIFGKQPEINATVVSWVKTIKHQLFKTKLANFVEKKRRTMADILNNNEEAYSEVLFYEIVKYRVNQNPDAADSSKLLFVQNMFLPNVGEMPTLKYIDTQVKYGKEYVYQIYAHTVVLGATYSRPPGSLAGSTSGNTYIAHKISPKMHLIRVPFYNTLTTADDGVVVEPPVPLVGQDFSATSEEIQNVGKLEKTLILDKPPVFPDVNIVPFKGSSNKILINLNFSAGEYKLTPVTLAPSEEIRIDRLYEAQKKSKGQPLDYRTDEYRGTFEILRIPFKPVSYKSFTPLSRSRIASFDSLLATTHIDVIKPNTDYYYTFRVRDIHGNISNPTPIYYVRIQDDIGVAPYTIIKSFFMEDLQEEKNGPKESISGMKYMMIKPAFDQTFINQNVMLGQLSSATEVASDTIVLGQEDKAEDVFGRKFKFRFTSKKTGRKFDVNIDVKRPAIIEKTDKTS